MNLINRHLDKNNLHHAYLIEGAREEIVPEVFDFIKSLGIETAGNADVSHISLDSFKIEDARNLKSLVSRFYLISTRQDLEEEGKDAEKFISLPLQKRIDFIKELLAESEEDEEVNEIVALDSARSRALKFLNALEFTLHQKLVSKRHLTSVFSSICLRSENFS